MAKKKAAPATTTVVKKAPGKPRNTKNMIPMGDTQVSVYASPRVSRELDEITEDMTLYHGVRLAQVVEAVYKQGQKDGARNAIEHLDKLVGEVKKAVPHRNPGQPKKAKK